MTRTDLEYIRHLDDLIYGAFMHIEELETRASSLSSRVDPIGGSRGSPVNRTELCAERIDAEERRANKLIYKRYLLEQEAIKVIRAAVEAQAERHILYMRYLAKHKRTRLPYTWPEIYPHITKRHNIQRSKIHRLHHIALNRIESYNI